MFNANSHCSLKNASKKFINYAAKINTETKSKVH